MTGPFLLRLFAQGFFVRLLEDETKVRTSGMSRVAVGEIANVAKVETQALGQAEHQARANFETILCANRQMHVERAQFAGGKVPAEVASTSEKIVLTLEVPRRSTVRLPRPRCEI